MRPVSLTFNLEHLLWNYHLLHKQAGESSIMAVVKANAYGHGMIQVSQTLFRAGCRQFAVTDAAEGTILRQHLPHDADIILLSGIFDADDAQSCVVNHLTPVVSHIQHIQYLASSDFHGQAWLKVDTGMNRIGADDVAYLLDTMQHHHIQLAGIMSHLACADTPEHPLNQQQIQAFKSIQEQHHAPAYSLMNSAGLVALMSDIDTDVVRPGIGLYGIEPIPSQPLGLKPVMQLSGSILQTRLVKTGESVSYGATWVASRDTWIGIVSLGYADGLPRILSNQGQLHHASGALPIIGRICMDYCMVSIDPLHVNQGDTVHVFGFEANLPTANHVAAQCHTITYELLTSIPARVPRQYIEEES